MMGTTFSVGLVGLFLVYFQVQVSAVDKGFEQFFKSQRTCFHDVNVNFTHPVPVWLKGTYVSTRLLFSKFVAL